MNRKKKILDNLLSLLVNFNIAVFILSLAFTTPKTSFGWETGNPLSYFINSRHFHAVLWMSLAALVLSFGIYSFVKGYLEAEDVNWKE